MNSIRHLMKDDVVFGIAMIHDMGACHEEVFKQNYFHYNSTYRNGQYFPLDNMIVFQYMSDYNTQCFYPEKDVAMTNIPAKWKILREKFGDLDKIKPINQRECFAHMKGSIWGTSF